MAALAHLKIVDPDGINLRKAARAAVVAPATYAVVAEVFDQPGAGLFAFFATLVGLVFADFAGPAPMRAAAYGAMVLLGDLVIAAASALSFNPATAAAGMFVVMFTASFATIYGRYAPAFVSVLALAYSLAVLEPLSQVDVADRIVGWTIGGSAALVAALVLWPVDRRLGIRESLARVSSLLSEAVAALDRHEVASANSSAPWPKLARARAKAATPLRPSGPAARAVGLLHLIENLEHATSMATDAMAERPTAADMALATEISGALTRTAAALAGTVGAGPIIDGVAPLDHARLVRLVGLRTEALEERGHAADRVAVMRSAFPLLALSHVALWIEADAAEVTDTAGGVHALPSAPELAPLPDQPTDTLRRAWHFARLEFDPRGVAFRNSLRGAVAMTAAVLVAELVPIEHAFWITLGTLAVLRSSASSTSASALQAVAGTSLGFLVSALTLLVFGGSEGAMWTLLPITVGLAGYTPGAVSFMVGQASFTTCVVVLFDLAEPGGVHTDLVRLETVTLGAAVAVVTGMLLWPRGAHATLAAALASVYRAAARGIRVVLTGTGPEREAAAVELRRSRRHADSAFASVLGERGQRVDPGVWIKVFCAPNLVRALLDGLVRDIERPGPAACTAAVAVMLDRRSAEARRLEAVADRLEASGRGHATAPITPLPSAGPTGLQADPCPQLRRCVEASSGDGSSLDDAVLLVAWNEWFSRIEEDLGQASNALDAVIRASAPRAWLQGGRRLGPQQGERTRQPASLAP